MPWTRAITVEPLRDDVVAAAQCMAIDADVFPWASAQFGLRASSARIWVAREEQGGRVLGFLAARVRGWVLHVDGVGVDREARRRGIGRALVRGVVAHAREQGWRGIVLHVSVANRPAIALYDAEGFVVRRRVRGFYPPAAFGGEADAYEMVRMLAP